MLELKVPEINVGRGAVEINWRVDRSMLRSLEGQPGEAFLLIVSAPTNLANNGSAQVRKLVPLSDGTAFVGFRCPGPHYVWGMIFVGDRRQIADLVLNRRHGSYDTDLISTMTMMPRSVVEGRVGGIIEGPTARIELEMPEECFAKKPPKWLMTWATWIWSSRGDDQCDFRKRLIFAFSLQLFVFFPIHMLIRLGAGIVHLSLGIPGIKYASLLKHPFSYSLSDLSSDAGTTIFMRRKLPWWLRFLPFAFMPAVHAVFIGITALTAYNEKTHLWRMTLKQICIWGGSVAALTALGLTVLAALYAFITTRTTTTMVRAPKGEVRFEADTVDALSGSTANAPSPSLSRRIVLIYEDVKAGICKPFSS